MQTKQLSFYGLQLTIIIIILTTFANGLDDGYKEKCGTMDALNKEQIQRIPWTATFHVESPSNPTADRFAAVIISPSLLLTSARYFLTGTYDKIILRKWTSYVAYANISTFTETDQINPFVQAVEITHVRFQPNIKITPPVNDHHWAYYANNTALIHLKTPLKLDYRYVIPVCIPTLENVENILNLAQSSSTAHETTVFYSGWQRYRPDLSIFHNLTVNSPETCKNYWKYGNYNETSLANYVDRYCANISRNEPHTYCINKDTAVVGKINQQGDKYFFLGMVNNFYSDNRICNSNTRVFVSQPTYSLLDVINNNINCGPSKFTCDNGECVSLESICNDTKECADGSDEDLTYCNAIRDGV